MFLSAYCAGALPVKLTERIGLTYRIRVGGKQAASF